MSFCLKAPRSHPFSFLTPGRHPVFREKLDYLLAPDILFKFVTVTWYLTCSLWCGVYMSHIAVSYERSNVSLLCIVLDLDYPYGLYTSCNAIRAFTIICITESNYFLSFPIKLLFVFIFFSFVVNSTNSSSNFH